MMGAVRMPRGQQFDKWAELPCSAVGWGEGSEGIQTGEGDCTGVICWD